MKNTRSSDLVLKTFLSSCSQEKQNELEKFLPEGDRLSLEELSPLESPICPEKFDPSAMTESVHWSWFLPTLQTYPIEEQKLFLGAMDSTSGKNIAKALKIPYEPQEITSIAKSYLKSILLSSLLGPNSQLLPKDYAPQWSLTPLLELPKLKIIELIDKLSLYDLLEEQKRIVETKILKKIYSFLSSDEKSFLKKIQGTKDTFPQHKMKLDRLDGSEETFRHLLHRRGLMRLGAALSGQDPNFIWHICHTLDIGRGSALLKLCGKEAISGISDTMIRQIEELL